MPSTSAADRQPLITSTEVAQGRAEARHAVGRTGGPDRTPSAQGHQPAYDRRLSRKWRATREGRYYIGITLGVGLAAINTGNNLLYLLLGMLLSLFIVSGVMSELSLRALTVIRRLPMRAQVGRPHLVEIEVYNHKKRVPSYAIEVEDLRFGQPADKRCFFLKISPGSAQVAAYRRTPAKRGRDKHTGFRIATRFPFGLIEKSREIKAEADLIIYPAVTPVALPPEQAGRRDGGATMNGRGSGDEVHGIRPMREGDDPRDIYWRKSTRADQMVLRERARETRPDIRLPLDVERPESAADDWMQHFERRIRDVASRAVAHIKRGDGVTVASTAGERVRGDRNAGADPILRYLALVEPTDAPQGRAEARPELTGPAVAALGQQIVAAAPSTTAELRRSSPPSRGPSPTRAPRERVP